LFNENCKDSIRLWRTNPNITMSSIPNKNISRRVFQPYRIGHDSSLVVETTMSGAKPYTCR
jgi:hypothetical protein